MATTLDAPLCLWNNAAYYKGSFLKEGFMAPTRRVPELSLLAYLKGNKTDQVKFVDDLFSGLKEYGFIILKEHPVAQEKVDRAYEYMNQFFQLPVATKLKYAGAELKKQRGYIPFGLEHAKDNPNPDLKEFWHTGRDITASDSLNAYYPQNVWPEEIPQFKQVQLELYQAMDATSKALLEAIGIALDVPRDYFLNMNRQGNSILRSIYYPATKGLDTKNSVRAAAHGDINLITLLVGATDSGLQLLDRDGSWLDVNSKPGEIVVDTGDMMSRITNDILPTTVHRVINPGNDRNARFSMPFFVHPEPEAVLNCVPSCVGKGAKYPPISSHDFLLQRLRAIGLY